MTFKVFHARETVDTRGRVNGIRGKFGFEPTRFPDDFRHVADVDAPELGAVFGLTNHIDSPWVNNPGVRIPDGVDPTRLRSTSVGDVIGTPTGFVAVASFGFTPEFTLDENFLATVPAVSGGL